MKYSTNISVASSHEEFSCTDGRNMDVVVLPGLAGLESNYTSRIMRNHVMQTTMTQTSVHILVSDHIIWFMESIISTLAAS